MQPIKIIPLHAARTGSWSNGTEQGAVWLSADLSLFASVWPQGQPAVSFERADGQKYAHACRMEDNLLYIPLDYADTEVPGLCKCAVSWLDGEREVRTTVYYGHVQQTITTLGAAPTEPEKGIIEQVNAAAVRAEKAADRAEAAGGGGGGFYFETDETLTLENGVLSVNTASVVEEDNTLPVTSAAVNTTVGNINALLATI